MKRSWFGAAILLFLLATGLGVSIAMKNIHRPAAEKLDQAAIQAVRGDWAGAREAAQEAGEQWQKWSTFRDCFADHGPMEDIDSAFARLGVLSAQGDMAEFAALCAELSKKVEDMSDAHVLSLGNFF